MLARRLGQVVEQLEPPRKVHRVAEPARVRSGRAAGDDLHLVADHVGQDQGDGGGGMDAAGQAPYATVADAQAAGAVTLNYGMFINTIISFLIVAFAIFIVIRNINRMKREEAAPPPAPTTKDCPYCFSAIALKAVRCPHCTSEIK